MVTHSSILAWEVPWTEEPGGLQSWGHDLVTEQQQIGKCMFRLHHLADWQDSFSASVSRCVQ